MMKAAQERRVDRFVLGMMIFATLLAVGLVIYT